MEKPIDEVALDGDRQVAEIYEGGMVRLHDNNAFQDIELTARAATLLFDFLLLHQEQLIRHRDAQSKI